MRTDPEDVCANCVHWIGPDEEMGSDAVRQGACRAHPPLVSVFLLESPTLPGLVDMGPQLIPRAVSNWPGTQSDQWCGEFSHPDD
jgi:hypothetical protein